MHGVASTRALVVSLPALALLGSVANAQTMPGALAAGARGGGLGGTDTFGVHSSPLGSDPLARGAGFNLYAEAGERAYLTSYTALYGDVSAGGEGFLNRDRVEASGTARITVRQPETGNRTSTQFLATGLARGAFDLVRNRVVLDLSAYADVLPTNQAAGTTINPQDQTGNLSQVFLISAQPRFRREIGTIAVANASYRASYVSVSGINGAGAGTTSNGGSLGGTGTNTGPTLQPLSNTFTQAGEASITNQPRDGRFKITLSGNLSEQEQARLDQRFRSVGGSFDLTYALTRVLGLVGNVGYSDYRSSQRAIAFSTSYLSGPLPASRLTTDRNNPNLLLRTVYPYAAEPVALYGAVGFGPNPSQFFALPSSPEYVIDAPALQPTTTSLTDPNLVSSFVRPYPNATSLVRAPVVVSRQPVITKGDFTPDPSGLRQTTYAQKGIVWNAGFRYAPSGRTLFEIRVGQRFAEVTVTGTVRKEFRGGLTVLGSLTDGIETFSSILTRTVNGNSTSFIGSGGGGTSLGGCIRVLKAGGCADTQSVSSGVFRSQFGTLGATLPRGLTNYSINYVYSYRRYLDTGASLAAAPALLDPTFAKRHDIIQRVFLTVDHRLDNRQRIEGGIFFGQNNLGLTRSTNDTYVGARVGYDVRISSRTDAFARTDITERVSGTIGNNTYSTVALGARYHF